MKVLKCKICEEEVEVPENRASVICTGCAEDQQVKKDLKAAIEKQKIKIQNCNALITRRKMIEELKMLYILHEPSDPMSKELRGFAEAFAREISK